MRFNSLEFAIFGLIFFVLYPLVKSHKEKRWLFLTFFSLLFYSFGEWRYLPFLLISGQLDYLIGNKLSKTSNHQKQLLFTSIFLNVGILLICKIPGYGFTSTPSWLPERLPLGVSFYTFQSMSYTFDIYLKRARPAKSWLHYMSFLSLFPQLIAGPICRARDILPQLEKDVCVSQEEKWAGLHLIVLGLFKKIIIADYLATYVDLAFSGSSNYSLYWFVIVTAYSFQLYFDFSAYSDIAIGLCKWMGINIDKNFDRPYLAKGLRSFWNRWHISLSTWFRDYVYIPLGGKDKVVVATMATMLLSALWHGLGTGFIVWGILHGFCLLVEKKFFKNIPSLLLWPWSILIVWHGWIFFRSNTLNQATNILKLIYTGKNYHQWSHFWIPYKDLVILVLLAIIIDVVPIKNKSIKNLLMAPAILMILFFYSPAKEFIYFRF